MFATMVNPPLFLLFTKFHRDFFFKFISPVIPHRILFLFWQQLRDRQLLNVLKNTGWHTQILYFFVVIFFSIQFQRFFSWGSKIGVGASFTNIFLPD
jgi:hypothetical protein